MTIVPPTPAGSTPASTGAEGFLLLTIPNVTLTSTAPSYPLSTPLTGMLSLECVTLDVADPLERDVWLVLRVEPSKPSSGTPFELPLPATQRVILSRSDGRYSLPMTNSGGGELVLIPSPAITSVQKEDLETLEVILAQYLALQIEGDIPPPIIGSTADFNPDGDLKGRLVLVDEDNGQVVGTLGDQFNIREDEILSETGSEKTPVVVEFPSDEEMMSAGPKVKREVFVHPIRVDDTDWVSKTAGLLGRGVVMATNVLSTGITTASNYYISHSKPAPQPMVFSETTTKNMKRVHNISGKAVKVTGKTTALIHRTVEQLADKVAGKGKGPAGGGYGLQPGASAASPYGSSTSFHPPSKDDKQWTSPYPGGTPHKDSATSFTPPPYQAAPSPVPGQAPPPLPRRRLLNRLLTSTDMLLTTLEFSASHLITHTTASLSAVATHKHGTEAGTAVGMVGDSVRNVAVVYIDMRGVGRRALLRVAGKRVIKARMGGKDVVFQDQGMGRGQIVSNASGVPVAGFGGRSPDTYTPPPYPPPQSSAGYDLEKK